jgi:hypothetical protein
MQCILEEYGVKLWNGFNWLMIASNDSPLWTWKWAFRCHKSNIFLDQVNNFIFSMQTIQRVVRKWKDISGCVSLSWKGFYDRSSGPAVPGHDKLKRHHDKDFSLDLVVLVTLDSMSNELMLLVALWFQYSSLQEIPGNPFVIFGIKTVSYLTEAVSAHTS